MTRENETGSPDNLFHIPPVENSTNVHLVLVRPEEPGNVGSIARVAANFGIQTPLRIVGTPHILSEQAYRFAKHARYILDQAQFFSSLEEALTKQLQHPNLSIATTAESGSSERPHPMGVREAMELAKAKQDDGEIKELMLVFGPEGDGLTNTDISKCDWIATIPTHRSYPSLNLAQATLVFCYELKMAHRVTRKTEELVAKRSQKQRLAKHILSVAEDVGFILPSDPFNMRPKLESLLNSLPNHVPEASTWHGLLDQISRSMKKGTPDIKGRYKAFWKKSMNEDTQKYDG